MSRIIHHCIGIDRIDRDNAGSDILIDIIIGGRAQIGICSAIFGSDSAAAGQSNDRLGGIDKMDDGVAFTEYNTVAAINLQADIALVVKSNPTSSMAIIR